MGDDRHDDPLSLTSLSRRFNRTLATKYWLKSYAVAMGVC